MAEVKRKYELRLRAAFEVLGVAPDEAAGHARPQDVPKFERQVEGYVNDLAAERAQQLERAESGK